jgi:hypothetical protein
MGHVANTTNDLGNSSLDGGWAELGRGHWDVALDCFERAVAKEESPEGFEGLSWAAWWLDDAEVVFAARNRAYHLYKQRGHAAGAARMAIWLACDHLDFHGALAVANGWLARAHRLLDGLEPGPEHGWLAFFEGSLQGLRFDDALSAFSAVERTNALLKESDNLAAKYEVAVSAEDWRPPNAG